MAKLQDVNFAYSGEQSENASSAEVMTVPAMSLIDEPAPTVKADYKIFKLVNKKKGRYYIDGIADVVNPKTGRQERIWLLSGAHTIWSSEMQELLKDKNYLNNNRISLEFQNGVMRVGLHEINKLEFIKHCHHLISDPTKRNQTTSRHPFFEYDPQKQQQEALNKELMELDMVMKAKDMPEDKMLKHASFLGVIFVDELGQRKTNQGIRQEYMLQAKRRPQIFKDTMDSKEVEVQYLVKRAILDAKIDLGKGGGAIYWANGGYITKLPVARKPLEYLSEFAMTNSDEGKAFLEQLQNRVK